FQHSYPNNTDISDQIDLTVAIEQLYCQSSCYIPHDISRDIIGRTSSKHASHISHLLFNPPPTHCGDQNDNLIDVNNSDNNINGDNNNRNNNDLDQYTDNTTLTHIVIENMRAATSYIPPPT